MSTVVEQVETARALLARHVAVVVRGALVCDPRVSRGCGGQRWPCAVARRAVATLTRAGETPI